MAKKRVYPATPYQYGRLGSLGDASYMLLRQYRFPDTYSEKDELIVRDHDRCMDQDYEHARRCFKEHTGTGECGLQAWLERATDEQVIKFLEDILKVDRNIGWTGYRITGTVNRGNGFPVWSLSLFAKHPQSDTKVYTGEDAPNVQARGR